MCEDTSILRESIKFAAVIPIYSILVIAAKSICLQSLKQIMCHNIVVYQFDKIILQWYSSKISS